MGTAMIKHPVSDRVKGVRPGHSDAQGWASECPDVKNYKWLNPVWHRMSYGNSGRQRINSKSYIYEMASLPNDH